MLFAFLAAVNISERPKRVSFFVKKNFRYLQKILFIFFFNTENKHNIRTWNFYVMEFVCVKLVLHIIIIIACSIKKAECIESLNLNDHVLVN